MTPVLFSIAVGTFGAILQELLFWYNARTKLDTDEYRAILKSARYWLVFIAMALGAGVASYLWFSPVPQAAKTYLLFGAGFPVLIKKAVDAFNPPQTHLGPDEAKSEVLHNYFRAS